VELFNQVPQDVLGFARTVVDENVTTLQKQFAQVRRRRPILGSIAEARVSFGLRCGVGGRVA
jgi:hypothetical protein